MHICWIANQVSAQGKIQKTQKHEQNQNKSTPCDFTCHFHNKRNKISRQNIGKPLLWVINNSDLLITANFSIHKSNIKNSAQQQ